MTERSLHRLPTFSSSITGPPALTRCALSTKQQPPVVDRKSSPSLHTQTNGPPYVTRLSLIYRQRSPTLDSSKHTLEATPEPSMTWKSHSTGGSSSSTASSLFDLDEESKANILVYKYRMGSKSLEVMSQSDLCKMLDSDPDNLPFMRVTRKEIPRGNSRLDILGQDLMLPEDVKKYAEKPTLKSSLANVGLPSTAYWKRLLFNSFPELFIVHKSPAPSPNSSVHTSPENSQHVSPIDASHPLQDSQAS